MAKKEVLIAYYSRRGENYVNGSIKNLKLGNTEVVAQKIKALLPDADMFQIDTTYEYSKSYMTCIEEAKQELHDQVRPEVKNPLKSIDEYDTIILGYPNWWGTMPMVCYTFLESYDFTGKTIIPFCTNEGSGMGSSVRFIKKLCPGANVEDGTPIHGAEAANADSEAREIAALAKEQKENMKKQVSVLVGAGSIGQAIIRRVSAGKHIVLADYSLEHAKQAAKTLENAGFECSTIKCDLGSKEDIRKLVEYATNKGEVTNVVNAAGVSPSQAPVKEILRVDLYGTSVLLEEFGKVIAEGGSGVIISSQSGHRLPALPQEQNEALAMTPVDELLELPFLKEINDTLKAYQFSKRCNVLRVMYEATQWGRRGATINSISPGIIITPLANDELHGPRKDGYLKMIEGMPARRAGTPDEVGDMAEFLMSSRGRFISGADFLIDGGCTASYWYGDLQYLKATH